MCRLHVFPMHACVICSFSPIFWQLNDMIFSFYTNILFHAYIWCLPIFFCSFSVMLFVPTVNISTMITFWFLMCLDFFCDYPIIFCSSCIVCCSSSSKLCSTLLILFLFLYCRDWLHWWQFFLASTSTFLHSSLVPLSFIYGGTIFLCFPYDCRFSFCSF
jgi:hypothetical protein